MAALSVQDSVCASCGHDFNDPARNGSKISQTVEILRGHQDEIQYEAYIEARLIQAQKTVKDLVALHGRTNWTSEQHREIKAALVEVKRLQGELKAQRLRCQEAKAMAEAISRKPMPSPLVVSDQNLSATSPAFRHGVKRAGS